MRFSPHCVLLDLDGTLVDTAPDLGYAANRVRADRGLPALTVTDYRPQASNGARGMLRVAFGVSPEDPEFKSLKARFLAYYREALSRESRLFDGVPALLDALERGGLRWGVVTNKPGWLARPLLADLGLAARAAVLVAGDTTAHPKPAPDPLLYACAALDLAPAQCLYVGDDERDISAGRAAGMPAIVAGWGYLGADTADPRTWRPDALAATPAALQEMLGFGNGR